MGGLGNQMQQYALYEKFKALGKETRLDTSWFDNASMQENVLARRSLELRLFDNLTYEACTPQEREALLGKEGFFNKLERKLFPSKTSIFMKVKCFIRKFSSLTMYILRDIGPAKNIIMILCRFCRVK